MKQLPLPLSEGRASTFWHHAFAINGSITPHVLPNVLIIGLTATLTCLASRFLNKYGIELGLSVAPYEFIGAALGLVLVLRTNAGYERWWEGRKLWGGIVNQCRNLAISATTYGPKDDNWQKEFLRWTAAFPHAARQSLRAQLHGDEFQTILSPEEIDSLLKAQHMPSAVAIKLAAMLNDGRKKNELDGFAFMQIDRERALLIDHIGACERIKKTPLALAYSIKIRRFIALFLLSLPFALIHELGAGWLVPVISMLVAYPLFSLDQLGAELQNPFDQNNLSHLPLEEISNTIEKNVLALKKDESSVPGENQNKYESAPCQLTDSIC